MPGESSDAFSIALTYHEAGRIDLARTLYREILAREPEHPESLHLLGLIMAQDGEPEAGAGMIQRAMCLAPGRAPHHSSLAVAYRILGRDAAADEYRAAADLRPESAEIHNNLATTLRALGQYEDAVAEYRQAARYAPDVAEIWYNLASILTENGEAEETEACFLRAITLRPNFADALANYGRWLMGQGRWVAAEGRLREAVRLAPEDARGWNNLGVTRQVLGRTPHAELNFRHAIALDPSFADAHYNLGCLLAGDGRTDDAIPHHIAALAADPLHGPARLALCIARLPVVYRTEPEIADRRAQYLAALDELGAAVKVPAVAAAVTAAIGTSQPFFLPYQGQNDRHPQATYGRLVCGLLGGTEPPPRPTGRPAPRERIRLGIVSGFFQEHTIYKLFLEGWLAELDRRRFEVTAFHTGQETGFVTAGRVAARERWVSGMRSLAAWRAAVADTAPHVLLYPEVGIDPTCAWLAAQRLAPIQCVAWGHPETTGMPTIDYFLSAELMEPPGAEAYYTEQLVCLPGLGVHYTPDEAEVPAADRVSLGLAPDVPVYWSGQAIYKYLPRYDEVYPRIAAAVGACQFVFIDFARSRAVTTIFRERLHRAFAAFALDANQYCAFLPPMPQQRFIAAAAAADITLDTPDWSGGRSTLDCLMLDPAIVTLPGMFMRGRHTAGILRQIGCQETIAGSLDEYVSIAVRLGLDGASRSRIRRAVAQGKPAAYRDTRPIRALETFLAGAVARL